MKRRAQKANLTGYTTRIGLAILVFAVVLSAPELAARWLGLDAGWSLRVGRMPCLRPSLTLHQELAPNCEGFFRGNRFTTNSLGFRGRRVRDDGSRLILMLGDSSTFGWGVSEHEPYPYKLQLLLDAELGPSRYQVINAGIPGYTAYQGLVLLQEKGLGLDPKIVTVSYGFNGTFRSKDIEEEIHRQARWVHLRMLDDLLMRHSRAYAWTRWELRSDPSDVDRLREAPDKYRERMTQIVTLARERGAKVVLIDFLPESRPLYTRALESVSRELSVPVVRYRGRRVDAVHPIGFGYRGIAEDVFLLLRKKSWLD